MRFRTHTHIEKTKKRSLIHRYFARLHTLRASDAFLLKVSLFSCILFLILTLIHISQKNSIETATSGGTYTEGILGTPRFINPVLAVTRADKDLVSLVYSGLMNIGPDGTLVPDIAESVTVSDDGLTYNVILKQNVRFHDGTPLTARDVLFTINRIQDPALASPLRANFDGIQVEIVGDYELNFVLPSPYAPFIENLTFGILPEHLWKDAGTEEFPFSQYNSEPIGTGPYQIQRIVRNTSSIPEEYTLTAFEQFYKGRPKIDTLTLRFYATEEKVLQAFKDNVIEGVSGVHPNTIALYGIDEKTHRLEHIPLPRTIALFFNQNKNPALRDISARKALNSVIDRDELVRQVLQGYGSALTSPIPKGFGFDSSTTTIPTHTDDARAILREGGWEFSSEEQVWKKDIDGVSTPLTFTISTVNTQDFEATAEFLRKTWEALGVPVSIKQFEQTDLTQAVIRPRDYDTLLFGTHLGRELDFYSFWHSSQRNDPGFNVALYANIVTDATLVTLRSDLNQAEREKHIYSFAEEIQKEVPAIFLYSPELLYVFPNKIHNARFVGVEDTNERFAHISEWYIETDSIWKSFISE